MTNAFNSPATGESGSTGLFRADFNKLDFFWTCSRLGVPRKKAVSSPERAAESLHRETQVSPCGFTVA